MQTNQNEETRKVQFTGGSTFIISLPKRWINQNQLERGSFIKLRQEENGTLIIIPPNSTIHKKLDQAAIKVSPKDKTETVTRKTISAYLAGFNSIYIKVGKQVAAKQLSLKQRHEIKIFVRHMLVGTEIVNDTSSQISLQVLLSYPELTVQNVLRRMSIITASMHKDAITAIKNNDHTLAKEVIATDNEVDRFNLYVIRQLKMAIQNPRLAKEVGLSSGKDSLCYRLVTKAVERTADHAVNIAENTLTLKHELDKKTVEVLEKMSTTAISMFETAIDSLFRQDYNNAESLIEKIKEVKELEKEAVASSATQKDTEEATALRLIIESIKRTAEYANDIAETVLNLTIESVLT
ncbi:MAG: phosphate uptake regulator PhoU [Candidatus Bathyarchaeota archaeon]|nr:phosphate uptake regulator PhoU [Candidatus Bathyarchaeota archaeon]